MSTTLNAEELAAKIDTDALNDSRAIGYVGTYDIQAYRLGASVAIEKIAQPIADERDELMKSLAELCTAFITHLSIERDIEHGNVPDMQTIEETAKFINGCVDRSCSIIEKYRKP